MTSEFLDLILKWKRFEARWRWILPTLYGPLIALNLAPAIIPPRRPLDLINIGVAICCAYTYYRCSAKNLARLKYISDLELEERSRLERLQDVLGKN